MKQIKGHEGLFQMDTTAMPYGPNELVVPRYFMPQTYGWSEQEEAAARFITACQEANGWCGISVPRLFDTMSQEYRVYYAACEAQQMAQAHNWSERMRYDREHPLYILLCVVTLGLYALFCKKPAQPDLHEISEVQVPFSIIYVFGPQHVITGLAELKDKGMLTVERHDDGFDVVFPTPELLAPISHYRRSSLQ